MIDHISIRNFAVIESTEIDFEPGLNVITGETGAGKSIMIEAVSLALGARADSSLVRRGTDKARIEMLAEDRLGEEIAVSREISPNGKNLCRVNGSIATLSSLAARAGEIADIHGQYDNQKLLDPANHLALVDGYRSDRIAPRRRAFDEAYAAYKKARSEKDQLQKRASESREKEDFLRFELKEIEDAKLKPGEDDGLEEEIRVLENQEKIFEAAEGAYACLSGREPSALSLISEARQSVAEIRGLTKDLGDASARLDSLYYDLEDIAGQIRGAAEPGSFRASDVDRAIARLEKINVLKKKYGSSIEEILAKAGEIRSSLDLLDRFEEDRNALEKETRQALSTLRGAADELTRAREKTAAELSDVIEQELQDLNFRDAKLRIEVRRESAIHANGQDACEILISLNPGEPLRPLAKTASGGEISRIMLAIKNATAAFDQVPTMIFDEIDSGISGVTASVVARKLREIAKEHQIICITHLPQIAAAADVQYRIRKSTDENAAYTEVEKLSDEARIEEIARLLGGDRVSETTRRSARELIESYQ